MSPNIDDPRLSGPTCLDLTPVNVLHENPWFSVCDRGGYYSVEYHQAQIVILPIIQAAGVILVWARRPLIADITCELPAGGVQDQESPVQAAARELTEETGVRVTDLSRFKPVTPYCVTPRYPCLTYVFRIDLTFDEYMNRSLHDQEIERVELAGFDQIRQRITSGEIYLCLPAALLGRFLLGEFRDE
jgi:8-oxo-dGTP pyrophosphatase MutT (NUDIX family)